jgi:hypothetical protein
MRKVRCEILPPVGPGSEAATLGLDEFLLSLPHLIYLGYVPPLPVVNAFLSEGIDDAGMGGGVEWEPFEIDQEEYEGVLNSWRAHGKGRDGTALIFELVRVEISSKLEWHACVWEKHAGVPYGRFLELVRKEVELARARKRLNAPEDSEQAEEAYAAWSAAAKELQEFMEPYLRQNQRRR